MTPDLELAMYGVKAADFRADVEEGMTFESISKTKGRASAYTFIAFSILSDAQELLARNDADGTRKAINRAKYLLWLAQTAEES